ncbi:hypothetical protein C8J56DRAFT_895335 [Mycena floridula]|nr:hypothetical protein C8J56DRAFT_895335 [Mycena floridula]
MIPFVVAQGWEILMIENTAGGSAANPCGGGGTTLKTSGSITCEVFISGLNTGMLILNNDQECEFTVYEGSDCDRGGQFTVTAVNQCAFFADHATITRVLDLLNTAIVKEMLRCWRTQFEKSSFPITFIFSGTAEASKHRWSNTGFFDNETASWKELNLSERQTSTRGRFTFNDLKAIWIVRLYTRFCFITWSYRSTLGLLITTESVWWFRNKHIQEIVADKPLALVAAEMWFLKELREDIKHDARGLLPAALFNDDVIRAANSTMYELSHPRLKNTTDSIGSSLALLNNKAFETGRHRVDERDHDLWRDFLKRLGSKSCASDEDAYRYPD